MRRIVHPGGAHRVEFDVTLTQQSITIRLHPRRCVAAIPERTRAAVSAADAQGWHEHIGMQGAAAVLKYLSKSNLVFYAEAMQNFKHGFF